MNGAVDRPGIPDGMDVRVHFASINTAVMTELCIRTMHQRAGYPFELVVGDCGSTDGSLPMLRRFERDGWLRLEVAPDGRPHSEWLDRWFAACDRKFAVFCDSDVEFRTEGWLRDMVETAAANEAALVATRIQARDGQRYRHPATGAERVLAPRPEPWLMLIDVARTRGIVDAGFGYRDEESSDSDVKTAFDIGAAFFRALQEKGLRYVEMPPAFARAYHHYGGMSWVRVGDSQMPMARRAKQALKQVRILSAVERARLTARHPNRQ